MEAKSFAANIKLDTSSKVEKVESKDGALSYLGWANALALAGFPVIKPVLFDGQIYLKMMGGGLVAVDIGSQRTWLPVMDGNNDPIPADKITSRDINDSLQRCKVKAIAMVTGVGLSLYAGMDGNGPGFSEALGVTVDHDLRQAKAVSRSLQNKTEYLDWVFALAAAKVSDTDFSWRVEEFAGQPYLTLNDTFMVAVEVSYKGASHVEYLPIMDVRDIGNGETRHAPLTEPNVFDWNRSIMRCLSRAIAVATGYGLSLYADAQPGASEATGNTGAKETPQPVPVDPKKIDDVRHFLKKENNGVEDKDEASLCAWLGVSKLEAASNGLLDKALNVLDPKRKKK